jgi:hypothetical protein
MRSFRIRFFYTLSPAADWCGMILSSEKFFKHHIEGKSCSQVIFVGAKDQKLMDQIQSDDSLHSLKASLTFNLKTFAKIKAREGY